MKLTPMRQRGVILSNTDYNKDFISYFDASWTLLAVYSIVYLSILFSFKYISGEILTFLAKYSHFWSVIVISGELSNIYFNTDSP